MIFQSVKSPLIGYLWFWSKNGHFSMVLVHKWPFFHFLFRQYRPGKCLLRYSRTTKTPFQAIKARSAKSRKIDFYYDGVNTCFWSKNGHFSKFFFSGNIGQENVFYDILERGNAFLSYKNKNFKKSKKGHFPKGVNPWFWSKNGNFSKFFFKVLQARKMSFTIFQNEKAPFQAIKTRSFKLEKSIFLQRG